MENKKITQDTLEQFDKRVRYQLDVHRKYHFGEIMTIIESLGLDDKQYNAVKSLLGKEIQRNYWEGITMLGSQMNSMFDYERQEAEGIEPLT